MALLEDLELDKVADAAEVEQQMASGGIVPEGLHHAALVGCREGAANSGTKFTELKFQVLAGPGKGLHIEETLFGPAGKSAESDERARNRMRLFAHRLGLLRKVPVEGQKDKFRYAPIEGGPKEFTDVLDKATCVVDVKHRDREYEKDGKKRTIKEAVLSFEGVLPVDDARVKEKKVPLGKYTPGANGTAAAGTLPRKDDYGDI